MGNSVGGGSAGSAGASGSEGSSSYSVTAASAAVVPKKEKKICCSCPETKGKRDECVAQNGQENCADFIEAHKACLRKEGFTVA